MGKIKRKSINSQGSPRAAAMLDEVYRSRFEAALTPTQYATFMEVCHAFGLGSDWSRWPEFPVLRSFMIHVAGRNVVRAHQRRGASKAKAIREAAAFLGIGASRLKMTLTNTDRIRRRIRSAGENEAPAEGL